MDDGWNIIVCYSAVFWVAVILYYVNKNRSKTRPTPPQNSHVNRLYGSNSSQLPSHDDSGMDGDWKDPNEEYERWSQKYDEERAEKAAKEAEHDAWVEARQERQERDEQMREEAYQEREWRNAQLEAEQEARWEAAQETRERLEAEREERWEAEQERRDQLEEEWRRKHGFDED